MLRGFDMCSKKDFPPGWWLFPGMLIGITMWIVLIAVVFQALG